MIKKIVFSLLILFVAPFNVFAADYVNHIINIEKFELDDEQNIFIEGYAFFSHQDNVGVFKKNGNEIGNLKTYIVAYTGDWKDDYLPDKCDNNSNCISFETDSDISYDLKKGKTLDNASNRSMWWARCTNKTCSALSYNLILRNNNDTVSSVKDYDGDEVYYNSTSCNNHPSYDSIGRQCLYENVGFKVEFNLMSIINKFSDGRNFYDGDINFKIVSVNTKLTGNCSDNLCKKYGVSGLAVYSSVCNINGENCTKNYDESSNTYNLSSGRYNIGISKLEPTVLFDAVSAGARDKNGNRIFNNTAVEFRNNVSFNILNIQNNIENSKTVSEVTGYFTDSLIQLDSIKDGNFIVPHFDSVDNTKNGDYYTWANFVTFSGSLVISGVSLKYEQFDCNDLLYEIHSTDNTEKDDADITCAGTSFNNTTQLWQCNGEKDELLQFDVASIIYIRNTNNNYKSDKMKKISGFDYLPVKVRTNILINQLGVFGFGNISNDNIRAGKGFQFNYLENAGRMVSPLNYSFYVEWAYRDWYVDKNYNGIINDITPYFEYSPVDDSDVYVYSCNNVSCNNPVYINIENYMSLSPDFHYIDINGNFEKVNKLDDAIFNSIDVFVQKNYYGDTENKISSLVRDEFNDLDKTSSTIASIEKFFDSRLQVKSCDSNSFSSGCDEVNVTGNWRLIDTNAAVIDDIEIKDDGINTGIKKRVGRRSWYMLNYNLPNAYIALSSNINYNGEKYNYGDILYDNITSEEVLKGYKFNDLGNKYYVGYKYSYDNLNGFDFPFNLDVDVNPSVVDEMEWTLNGTCGVDVDNGLFDDKGKPLYRYRSISLGMPFPKGINSKNWDGWYKRETNVNRLKNIYNYEPIYLVTLSKNASMAGVEIGWVNSCSSMGANQDYGCSKSYGTFDGLSIEGVSNLVDSYRWAKNNHNSYCGLGFFSSRCDAFPDGTILDIEGDLEIEDDSLKEGVDIPIKIPPTTPNPGLETS